MIKRRFHLMRKKGRKIQVLHLKHPEWQVHGMYQKENKTLLSRVFKVSDCSHPPPPHRVKLVEKKCFTCLVLLNSWMPIGFWLCYLIPQTLKNLHQQHKEVCRQALLSFWLWGGKQTVKFHKTSKSINFISSTKSHTFRLFYEISWC